MRKTFFLSLVSISLLTIVSCEISNNQSKIESIDYSDKNVLDSLIRTTPNSNDTIFLGFIMGMSKTDYRNHIHKLRNDGLSLTYSQSNRIKNFAGTFELGPGYTFSTSISANVSDKTVTGQGLYFLEPKYSDQGTLVRLNVISVEKWSSYMSKEPNWFESRIEENSIPFRNENFKKALVNNDIIYNRSFIRQKGNVLIFQNSNTYSYVPINSILIELLLNAIEKELIEEKNQTITF